MKNLMVILCLVFLVGGNYGVLNAQGKTPKEARLESLTGYKIGDVATDFNLKNVDGQMVSLERIKNAKGYIVVFTSNVCPFAILYQDRLIELHNKMAPKGYPVVAINSNDATMQAADNFESMQIRAKEKAFPFVYLKDDQQKIFPQYGATKTPHVFLLDKALVVQYIGAIDDNPHAPEEVEMKYVENAIDALEKGDSPNPNYTKAIGCPIKSKKRIAGAEGRPPRGDRKGPPSAEKILEMMDENNDQKVSKAEVNGPLKNDFDRLDKDEDGYLTVKELSALRPNRGKRD